MVMTISLRNVQMLGIQLVLWSMCSCCHSLMHRIVRIIYHQNLYASVLDGVFGRQVGKLGVFGCYLLWNSHYGHSDFGYSYVSLLVEFIYPSIWKEMFNLNVVEYNWTLLVLSFTYLQSHIIVRFYLLISWWL